MKEIFKFVIFILLVKGALELVLNVRQEKRSEQKYIKAIEDLGDARNEWASYYPLQQAAKLAFVQGEFEEAEKYARELQSLTAGFVDEQDKGQGIHDANLVLGRLALRKGDVDDAKGYLLAAGQTSGSPGLNSFGPNMSLAKDLLEQGEQEVVLEYFELCRLFWEMDQGRLDKWVKQAKRGRVPDFGANLLF